MRKMAWVVVIAVAIVLVIAFVASFFFPQIYGSGYGYHGGMMGPWMMGGMGIFGLVTGLLFLLLLIGGTVWLVQALTRGGGAFPSGSPGETPLEILKRRYAKGEITKEQYDGMRRDLGA